MKTIDRTEEKSSSPDIKVICNPYHRHHQSPDVWHRYNPKQNNGWKEYYAVFQESFANQHIMSRYSQYLKEPVVYIGFREKILDIYNKLIEEV